MTGSRRPRGRALAWAFCAVAIGVGAALGYLIEDRLFEAWHLRRFREGDRETKLDAARRLSSLKSAAAAPLLIEEIARGMDAEMKRREIVTGDPRGLLGHFEKDLLDALAGTGKPALPALIAALAPSENKTLSTLSRVLVAMWALETIDPRFRWRRDKTDEPQHYTALREIAEDPAEDPALRSLASRTLLQLEKRWREKRVR